MWRTRISTWAANWGDFFFEHPKRTVIIAFVTMWLIAPDTLAALIARGIHKFQELIAWAIVIGLFYLLLKKGK